MIPTRIIVHCSATKPDHDLTIDDVRGWHKARGWRDVGYHYFIRLDGTVEIGRPWHTQGAHVRGHNNDTLGICYAGGVNAKGKPANTLTMQQQLALIELVKAIQLVMGPLPVFGHRDLSPDKDGDGVVEPHEFLKACPSFDVIDVLGPLCQR